jgi:hypothetical protein
MMADISVCTTGTKEPFDVDERAWLAASAQGDSGFGEVVNEKNKTDERQAQLENWRRRYAFVTERLPELGDSAGHLSRREGSDKNDQDLPQESRGIPARSRPALGPKRRHPDVE